ncbi:MAG: cobyrinic acid ac-diamide synthase [Anaerolineales bacterium]|jgi:CO dehydrogenase maturation factor|nr:MAG: cobyrinic acid ac-diamide synthase [Anaerolineales bacterium]
MKIAITGKGGVGKTTLTSLLAYTYADLGYQVLAVDADPSPCLGAALGFPDDLLAGLTPIARMDELIYERTGAQPGTTGGFFKLNPRVDDLPDRFSAVQGNIRLLELGAVEMGGSGCICPESTMLRSLITHILLRMDEVVLMDMYAGVEHLGRATADAVDAMIIVVEPTARSIGTATQIKSLAEDLKLAKLYLVGSKLRNEDDRAFIMSRSPGLPILGYLFNDERVIEADRKGVAVYNESPELVEETRNIVNSLQSV